MPPDDTDDKSPTRAPRRANFHNADPADSLPPSMPKEIARVEFGRRINRMLILKGWNQSELARKANAHKPEGSVATMNRDLVSKYVRGEALPNPARLQMLADAFGVKPRDLLPDRGAPEAGEAMPPVDVRDSGDGTVWLRVNQSVPWGDALKILNILKGEG